MARIFITGSADGLGLLSARLLMNRGHQVVMHARNQERWEYLAERTPKVEKVLVADLSVVEETIALAAQVNELGSFDAVIHNAGVYQASARDIFYVNTLAPYILTGLITKPKRLIYLSSGMHQGGQVNLEHMKQGTTYSDSKLHVLMLALAAARKWPEVFANAVDPGWVPTKMGGRNAPDDLDKGFETQTWLAVSNDTKAKVSGRYFYHQKEKTHSKLADDVALQEKLLRVCQEVTGVAWPA